MFGVGLTDALKAIEPKSEGSVPSGPTCNRSSLAACGIGAEALVDPLPRQFAISPTSGWRSAGWTSPTRRQEVPPRGGETENAATRSIIAPLAGSSREVGDPVPARARGYA